MRRAEIEAEKEASKKKADHHRLAVQAAEENKSFSRPFVREMPVKGYLGAVKEELSARYPGRRIKIREVDHPLTWIQVLPKTDMEEDAESITHSIRQYGYSLYSGPKHVDRVISARGAVYIFAGLRSDIDYINFEEYIIGVRSGGSGMRESPNLFATSIEKGHFTHSRTLRLPTIRLTMLLNDARFMGQAREFTHAAFSQMAEQMYGWSIYRD